MAVYKVFVSGAPVCGPFRALEKAREAQRTVIAQGSPADQVIVRQKRRIDRHRTGWSNIDDNFIRLTT
ncbi:hypothetical protein [Asticcacaulis taihuensis]|uniref:hypothetical protein n=1 Tax=Asticcacaulis taihuensis TaxID=260084 RepID=UPI0026ECC90B|nr:hypothetical protein [Asticcacaulis taihuensis]